MKIEVGVLGATGMIGQHYVSLLQNHPWFEIKCLAASESSPSYKQAMQGRWHQTQPLIKDYPVSTLDEFIPCPLVFSALPNHLAQSYEPKLAALGCIIISSASCYRKSHPLIIPEINPHHIQGNKIITKPNCAVQSFLLPLAPLHKLAEIKALSVTTLQAMSGSGNSGVNAPEFLENVIPYIEGEEEKLETEPLKILEANFPISAQCNRVPVVHGHLACVSVSFKRKLTREEILECWKTPSSLQLPLAPSLPVVYHDDPKRPQPRLDLENGMSVTVGRLRPCSQYNWRFVALSHNAIRGGAGGGVLIGELVVNNK